MATFVQAQQLHPKQGNMRERGIRMEVLGDTRRGLAYVNPVERFTPARKAETMEALVLYAVL